MENRDLDVSSLIFFFFSFFFFDKIVFHGFTLLFVDNGYTLPRGKSERRKRKSKLMIFLPD